MTRTYKGWTKHEADYEKHWFPYYSKEGFPDIVDQDDGTFKTWGDPSSRFEVFVRIDNRPVWFHFSKITQAIKTAEEYPVQAFA